jgi:hypothetical protein
MKNVLLVTGESKECGIYQYADSVFEILKTSTKYEFDFLATNNKEDLYNHLEENDTVAIIYNHHPHTMNWLNSSITRPIHNAGLVKQIAIFGHEHLNTFTGADYYIHTDPNAELEENEFAGIPPITYYDDIQYSKPNGTIKIGTSGISNRTKDLPTLIRLINEQFTEDVILNLHVSDGVFVDPTGKLSGALVDKCLELANSNVKINFTRDFLSKKDLISWLNQNDINLYWYQTPEVPGVSGSIDRALASRKPFGVNHSSFFSHVRRDFNDLTKTSIKDIIAAGVEPLQEFYDAWNPTNLLNLYESIIEK